MKHLRKFGEKTNEEFIMLDILSSDIIKKIKKLKCMGTNAECVGYDDAKKEIIDLIKKESLRDQKLDKRDFIN
jgi:hypothetical protein